jgi:hypothetical protein
MRILNEPNQCLVYPVCYPCQSVRRTQRDRLCTVFVSIRIIRKVAVDANGSCLLRFTVLQSRLCTTCILFCFECKWFGGVITIKSVDTVAHI